MPTTVEDFISAIQCCHLWFKKDVELLFKAKLANSRYWGVRLSPIYEFPSHCWLYTFIFQVMDVFAQGSLAGFTVFK